MNRITSSLALALLLTACGSSQTHTPSEDDTSDTCVAPGAPNAETCGFVVNGCCYTTAALACQAAGCTEDRCTILESFPAQAVCP